MLKSKELCQMRHENGNCLPCGGFCLAVNPLICESVQNAYDMGMRDGITATMHAKSMVLQKRGMWEYGGKTPSGNVVLICSECRHDRVQQFFKAPDKYCPNCGARMDGET